MESRPANADELVNFMAGAQADLAASGLPAVLNNLKGLAGAVVGVGIAAILANPVVKHQMDLYLAKEIQGRPPMPPEAE